MLDSLLCFFYADVSVLCFAFEVRFLSSDGKNPETTSHFRKKFSFDALLALLCYSSLQCLILCFASLF
jgi:hypothetical protein